MYFTLIYIYFYLHIYIWALIIHRHVSNFFTNYQSPPQLRIRSGVSNISRKYAKSFFHLLLTTQKKTHKVVVYISSIVVHKALNFSHQKAGSFKTRICCISPHHIIHEALFAITTLISTMSTDME